MDLWLTNTTPPTEPVNVGKPVQFSARASGGVVDLATLIANYGITRLGLGTDIPENDSNLLTNGVLTYDTPDHVRPVMGLCLKTLNSGRLVITRVDDDVECESVYEYKAPLRGDGSNLSYIKIRRWPWSLRESMLIPMVTNLASPWFQVRNNQLQTSCLLSLRDDGNDGTLVVSGAYQLSDTDRTVAEVAFPWKLLSNEEPIELWVFFNNGGLPDGYGVPEFVPIFEVWGRLPSDVGPRLLLRRSTADLLSLDGFPREDAVTICFGNMGLTGDVVDIEDWALYADFRASVIHSDATPNHSILILPDLPVVYKASSKLLPTEVAPARWFHLSGKATVPPNASFGYAPSRKRSPQSLILDKFKVVAGEKLAVSGRMGYERTEPAFDGFMIEALMSAKAHHLDSEAVGAGIGVHDGLRAHRLLLYQTVDRKTVGVQSTVTGDTLQDQHTTLTDVDWTQPRLLRLAYDPVRLKITAWVDDEQFIELSKTTTLPRSNNSIVEFGHILNVGSHALLNVANINYLTRYRAYEVADGELPASPDYFVEDRTDGFSEIVNGKLVITKTSVHQRHTRNHFERAEPLQRLGGSVFEFRARCPMFWDHKGTPMAAESFTGAGFNIELGGQKLQLGFYNCGVYGRRIGIVPPTGEREILDQTDIGRGYSTEIDWTEMQTYRIHIKAFDKIEVWVGSVTDTPVLTIPWKNDLREFPLPVSNEPSGFSFGHFGGGQASITEWEFVRWGVSSGYDLAISQSYPGGVREDQHGGRFFLFTDFSG